MQLDFIKCHGTGNDFPLIDARAIDLSDAEWASVARALANRAGPVGGDGLLLLTAGDADHAFGMRMFNSDGSEAETCLNGLRCVSRLGFELLGGRVAQVRLKMSSAEVRGVGDLAAGAMMVSTRVGPAGRDIGLTGSLSDVVDFREYTPVSMPNPHLVTFLGEEEYMGDTEGRLDADLSAVGEACNTITEVVPNGANVSFARISMPPYGSGDDLALYVRTYERGVGLTDSCGSAMGASIFAAGLAGRVPFDTETTISCPGGWVRATAEMNGFVTIMGNATFVYDATIEVDPVTGTAEAVQNLKPRDPEVSGPDGVPPSLY
jgi:diaminopimelate epimerase